MTSRTLTVIDLILLTRQGSVLKKLMELFVKIGCACDMSDTGLDHARSGWGFDYYQVVLLELTTLHKIKLIVIHLEDSSSC